MGDLTFQPPDQPKAEHVFLRGSWNQNVLQVASLVPSVARWVEPFRALEGSLRTLKGPLGHFRVLP